MAYEQPRYDVTKRFPGLELRDYSRRKHMEALGELVWARYDPPFKPWFLRRNEILFVVRPAADPRDTSS